MKSINDTTCYTCKSMMKTISIFILCALFSIIIWDTSLSSHAATVKLSKTSATLLKGKTLTLKVSGTKTKPIWYSSDKSIATVTQKGIVKGQKIGDATIYAKIGSKKFTCALTVEDIFTVKNGTLYKYNGKGGKVVIPSTVTRIFFEAFNGRKDITSITIPSSVKTIDHSAFYGCSKLTNISIPKSLKNMYFDSFAYTPWFTNKRKENPMVIINGILIDAMTYKPTDGKLVIPSTVNCILDSAFENERGITSVTIPESVTRIQGNPFVYCSSIEEIDIPKTLTSFVATEESTPIFSDTIWSSKQKEKSPMIIINGVLIDGTQCKGEVIVPDSVHTISKKAFYRNKSITSITLPETLTTIGDLSFTHCSKLNTINFPKSLKSIGMNAFYDTMWLKEKSKENPLVIVNSILVDGHTATGIVSIPATVKRINSAAFMSGNNITKVILPSSITSIGDSAFTGCPNLTTITIPDSVTRIEQDAFLPYAKLVLRGSKNSYAQKYAKANGLMFEPINKAKVRLNITQCPLLIGQTYKLKLIGTSKKVKWTTDNKYIVSVTSTGKVKGLDVGRATIYAKVGTKTYTCNVKVSD